MRRTRHQLLQLIDADYYGFRDEEDGILVQVEAEAEAKLRAEVHLSCLHANAANGAIEAVRS